MELVVVEWACRHWQVVHSFSVQAPPADVFVVVLDVNHLALFVDVRASLFHGVPAPLELDPQTHVRVIRAPLLRARDQVLHDRYVASLKLSGSTQEESMVDLVEGLSVEALEHRVQERDDVGQESVILVAYCSYLAVLAQLKHRILRSVLLVQFAITT